MSKNVKYLDGAILKNYLVKLSVEFFDFTTQLFSMVTFIPERHRILDHDCSLELYCTELKLLYLMMWPIFPLQVMIEVEVSGVNPVDTYIRSGQFGFVPDLPYTLGMDGAGLVHQVGRNVSKFMVCR